MCKPCWIGVDLGKKSFVAALAMQGTPAEAWATMPTREFANDAAGLDALVAWAEQNGPIEILGLCVESTGRLSWTFIQALDGRLGAVSMLNPARSCAFAKSLGLRSKSDRIDACVLALYGQAMAPKPTAIPSLFQRQLRELSHLYDQTLKEKIACENRLREPIDSPFVQALLSGKVQRAKEELLRIEQEMDTLFATDAQLEQDQSRMQTIPGVGPKTARVLLARFGDLRTYTRNELVALAGIYPRTHQSGTSVHKKATLARGGQSRVRAALYMAALSAMRHCPQLMRYAQRLGQKGLAPMAVLGAIMRKLLLMIRALVVSGKQYDPNHGDPLQSQTA